MKETTLKVRGARQNNLRNIDLDLHRDQLIVFTGPSGSGKTSLAIDTLHSEGQRRLIEALGAGRRFDLSRPDVDVITGLPPTIGVLQHAQVQSRSTVGSLTETGPLLRSLSAHHGIVHCAICDRPLPALPAERIAATLADLAEGSRLTFLAPVRRQQDGDLHRLLQEIHAQGFARVRIDGEMYHLEDAPQVNPDHPHDLEVVVDRVKVSPDRTARIFEAVQTSLAAGDGRLIVLCATSRGAVADPLQFADHPYCFVDDVRWPRPTPRALSANAPEGACEHCGGRGCAVCAHTGLGPLARQVRLGEHSLQHLLTAPLSATRETLSSLPPVHGAEALQAELDRRLKTLIDLGLGHLPLSRRAPELSSGERSRTRLAGQTGHQLSGVLFVLDEPTAGLHEQDLPGVISYIKQLREGGNTVLVIDHHPLVVHNADVEVRFGPGAGPNGGLIIHNGPPQPTQQPSIPNITPRRFSGGLRLEGASGRNLDAISVRFPNGKWTAVFGVSGSGKSTLISATLAPAVAVALGQKGEPLPYRRLTGTKGVQRLLHLDRGPVSRSARSSTATAVGVWTSIRNLLASTRSARIRGFGPQRFSFNRAGGRCEACQGVGHRTLQLDYLPDAVVICEVCEGRRFDAATLSVEYKGASVHDILEMSVDQARTHFANQPRILRMLTALRDVGLGYLPLGQTADTFSGGEAQRLRLASELARARRDSLADTVVILDEPAAALHPDDAHHIIDSLKRLVSRGATVITVAYQPALLAAADHLIEMGPGAGPDGGTIIGQQ
ncbi:MAG: hypothetical protein AAFV53_18695 [Myxococcota bacterium]